MSKRNNKSIYVKSGLALGLMALLLTGCGQKANAVEPEATAYATSEPTAVPTATPEPKEVSVDLAAWTPAPTSTPMVSPTPTPTPTPSPVPSPTAIPFSYYAPTVNMSFEELVGGLEDSYYEKEGTEPIMPKGYPAAGTYKLIVDVQWQVVMAYSKDENGEYTVPVRYMLCSTGSAKNGPTKIGTFPLKECRLRFGTFASGDFSAQYWTLIVSRTYFHSVVYHRGLRDGTKDLNSVYVDKYLKLGQKDSHGCIRLPVPDARWIFYNCCYGTEVEIREGDKNDLETKAIREQLKLAEPPAVVTGLAPGSAPYTDNWFIDDVPLEAEFVNATPPPAPKN
ncbi:MAG: L,D-transpeptidase [Clostridia bacterium]|nr:L,D-transpeptidase [Clostridia bacterium]